MQSPNWFDVDTAVCPIGDGQHLARLSGRWNRLGGGPLGGYSLAVAMRAIAETLPHPDPLVVSAHFLRPAVVGDARISTEILKTGARQSTATAVLAQHGTPVLAATATSTDLATRRGTTVRLAEPPDLPPPESCVDPLDGVPVGDVTIRDRVEYRSPRRPGWIDGCPSGVPSVELWMRLTDPGPIGLSALALLVDASAPAVLELGETGSATVELTVHLRRRPAPGWLACRVSTRHVSDGLHEEDVEIWDGTGHLVAQSRQLALLPATSHVA